MAIDYGNYAQLYGGGADLSNLTQGIQQAKQNTEERNIRKASKVVEGHFNDQMKPFTDAAFKDLSALPDVGTKDFVDFGSYNAGKGFADLTALHGNQRGKIKGIIDESGMMSAGNYSQKYNEMLNSYLPMIERKLETYQQVNHLSDKEMKQFIEDKGLQKLLLNYGAMEGASRGWAMPDQTWKQWWGKKGPVQKAVFTAGIPIAGTGTYKIGKDLFGPKGKGFKGRYFSADKKALGLTEKGKTGAIKALGWEGKTTKAGKIAMQKATSAQRAATTAITNAKKLGKSKKVIAGLEKTRAAAVIANKAAKSGAAKAPMTTLTNFVKKKGVSGLMKKVIAKVGYRGAAKLLGRSALSLGLKGTGIGALASLALDASTIWWLASIIKDVRK